MKAKVILVSRLHMPPKGKHEVKAMKSIFRLITSINHRFRKIKATAISNTFGSCGPGLKLWGSFQIKNRSNFYAGRNLSINDYVYINALGDIYLGDNVSLSAGCMLISTGLDKNSSPFNLKHVSKPIKIGNNVQIGAGAIILAGVEIGDNVIIGAGAVVTKNVTTNSVMIGVPSRNIKNDYH